MQSLSPSYVSVNDHIILRIIKLLLLLTPVRKPVQISSPSYAQGFVPRANTNFGKGGCTHLVMSVEVVM